MNLIIQIVKYIDLKLCRYIDAISPERPSIIIINFHKIFKNKNDILLSGVDPQQGTTLEEFRIIIEYFLSAGYIFIPPDDISNKLNNSGKYILITFDDGYYNNSFALPLLQEYQIPTIFFISSSNVLNNEPFWWDVIYKLKVNGTKAKEINSLKRSIKKMEPRRVKELLLAKFPGEIIKPKNEYDRPFTVNELKDFSNENLVIIGNHTADHAILTNCSLIEAENQIKRAQTELEKITGAAPKYLAYPNGNYSNEIISIVQKMEFKLAFTTERIKNFLPLTSDLRLLKLARFMVSKYFNFPEDGMLFRSNYSLFNAAINYYNKFNNYRFRK